MTSAEEAFFQPPAEWKLSIGIKMNVCVCVLHLLFWIKANQNKTMPWAPQFRPGLDGKILASDQPASDDSLHAPHHPDELLVYQEGTYAFTTWASEGADYATAWVCNGSQWVKQPVDMHSIGWWRGEMLKPVSSFSLTAETWASCQFVNAWIHALAMFRVKTDPNKMQVLWERGHYYKCAEVPWTPVTAVCFEKKVCSPFQKRTFCRRSLTYFLQKKGYSTFLQKKDSQAASAEEEHP